MKNNLPFDVAHIEVGLGGQSAAFSLCGKYRWWLSWPTGLLSPRRMAVCGANPSVAGRLRPDGSMRSDPTVSRMRNLARDLGYGWLDMVNARSWIATDPTLVPRDPEAIGRSTDWAISEAARTCSLFLAAYGLLAGPRGEVVLKLCRDAGKVPHALALTKDGTPRHPRGVPASARPFPMEKA